MVSTKRPASLRAATTATLAWNRFIPCGGVEVCLCDKSCATDLEFFPSIGVKGSVVVEDVDEWKAMTNSDLIIISVMGGSNLHSSGTELHVDDNGVRDDWDSAIDERMDGEFSVKMLRVVRTGNTPRGSWKLTVYLGS